jgi:hypothetical protein
MDQSLRQLCSKWDNGSIGEDDYAYLSTLSVGRVLEFGPGNSTIAFLEAGNVVTSIEHDPKWYKYWSSRLPNKVLYAPRLNRLKLKSYDMVFVDAPHGNRWAQCQWSMHHTRHILLHDARLPENQRVAMIFKIRKWSVKLIETHHGIWDFTS